jgi:hypothetical protein
MADVEFQDFSLQVKAAIDENAEKFLYEAGELIKGQVVPITPVKTGQLKGSWDYRVDLGHDEVKIGSPSENAIWNEFGTGEYAAKGDGRKGGWSYKDDSGNWHHTTGKKPNRTLQRAFDSTKGKIINRAKQIFKEGMK